MSADEIVTVRILSVGGRARAAWLEGLDVHLPSSILDRAGWRRLVGPNGDLQIPPEPAPISEQDVAQLRERCAFTDRAPLSARLPVSYRRVPGWARAAAASVLGRWNLRRVDRWATFPGWPIDLSADALDDLRDETAATPARRGRRTPVVLTHDIESAEGLTNLIARFVPLEDAVGARSTSYIVPCASPLEPALIDELVTRGHDVGVHGYDHSHRTPFADAAERRRRLDAARPFVERYGAVGYRAPSLLRTRALLGDLGARYQYDSSIPTSGGLFPVPNNGCATARPFVVEQTAELPLTLPRDGSLRFLGYTPDQIAQMWIECAEFVARSGGVVVLLTHCEDRFSGDAGMLATYQRFLTYIHDRSDCFAFARAAQVAEEAGGRRSPETVAITRASAN